MIKLNEFLNILNFDNLINLYELHCNNQIYDYNKDKNKLNPLYMDYKVKSTKIDITEDFEGNKFFTLIIIIEGK